MLHRLPCTARLVSRRPALARAARPALQLSRPVLHRTAPPRTAPRCAVRPCTAAVWAHALALVLVLVLVLALALALALVPALALPLALPLQLLHANRMVIAR